VHPQQRDEQCPAGREHPRHEHPPRHGRVGQERDQHGREDDAEAGHAGDVADLRPRQVALFQEHGQERQHRAHHAEGEEVLGPDAPHGEDDNRPTRLFHVLQPGFRPRGGVYLV